MTSYPTLIRPPTAQTAPRFAATMVVRREDMRAPRIIPHRHYTIGPIEIRIDRTPGKRIGYVSIFDRAVYMCRFCKALGARFTR